MSGFVRRVVTGHDKQGKAIVISDGIAPMVHNNAFVANYRTSDIWKTTAMPAPITAAEPDAISGPRSFVTAILGQNVDIPTFADGHRAQLLIDDVLKLVATKP